MCVDEVILGECDGGEGAGLRTEPLRTDTSQRAKDSSAHKDSSSEKGQPGKGEGSTERHVLEARGRECFQRQEIGQN